MNFGLEPPKYLYSVSFNNESDVAISILPSFINDLDMTIGVGDLGPGATKTISKGYLEKPKQYVVIKYKQLNSNEIEQVKAVINLPKEFTKKNGREISFYIDPIKKKVRIKYIIFDEKKEDFYEIGE